MIFSTAQLGCRRLCIDSCHRDSLLFSRAFHSSYPFAGQVKRRMPPKKAAAPEKKVLLGRPGNSLKIGIVGALCMIIVDIVLTKSVRRSPQCRQVLVL